MQLPGTISHMHPLFLSPLLSEPIWVCFLYQPFLLFVNKISIFCVLLLLGIYIQYLCCSLLSCLSYLFLSALWSYFSATHPVWGATKEPGSLKSITLSGGEYRHLSLLVSPSSITDNPFSLSFLSLSLLIYPHLCFSIFYFSLSLHFFLFSPLSCLEKCVQKLLHYAYAWHKDWT